MSILGMRSILLAILVSLALVAPAVGQVPPPVPALPDSPRITAYSISGSTCACSVGFALYGDSTDYYDWVQVWVNGVNVAWNDPTFGWAITSPTGPLSSIARPITDAVLTFNQAQTGTVEIVGARRPRRLTQFTEGRGVGARDQNVALTDQQAISREIWDLRSRLVQAPAGESLTTLPAASSRANLFACWDSGGNPAACSGAPATNPVNNASLSPMPANTVKCNPTSISGQPQDCTQLTSMSFPANPVWYGADPTGANDSTAAFNAAIAASHAVYFPPGRFKINSAITVNLGSNLSLSVTCAGSQNTQLYFPNGIGITVNYSSGQQSTHWSGCTLTTGALGAGSGITLNNSVALGSIMPTTLYDMVFMGDDRNNGGPTSDYWSFGVTSNGVSNINFESNQFYGNAAGTLGNGISLGPSVNSTFFGISYNINNSNFFATNIGISYGSFIQGVTVHHCNFVNGQVGIDVPPAESSLDQLTVTDSQFNTLLDQIFIQTSVQNAYFAHNLFFVTSGHSGIDLQANMSMKVIGNDFGPFTTPGTGTGISVSGISVAGAIQTIEGNFFNSLAAAITTSGTAPGLFVQGNAYNANTATIIDTGATNDRIYDNPLAATTPSATASPWTFTNGGRPAFLYLMGTGISVTTDGGANVCNNTTNCVVYLRPLQSTVVTFSTLVTDSLVYQ